VPYAVATALVAFYFQRKGKQAEQHGAYTARETMIPPAKSESPTPKSVDNDPAALRASSPSTGCSAVYSLRRKPRVELNSERPKSRLRRSVLWGLIVLACGLGAVLAGPHLMIRREWELRAPRIDEPHYTVRDDLPLWRWHREGSFRAKVECETARTRMYKITADQWLAESRESRENFNASIRVYQNPRAVSQYQLEAMAAIRALEAERSARLGADLLAARYAWCVASDDERLSQTNR